MKKIPVFRYIGSCKISDNIDLADVDLLDNPITILNGRFKLIGKASSFISIVTDGNMLFGVRGKFADIAEKSLSKILEKSEKMKNKTKDYKGVKSKEYLDNNDKSIPIFLYINSKLITNRVSLEDIELIDYHESVIDGKYKQIGICAGFPILTDGNKVFGVKYISEGDIEK